MCLIRILDWPRMDMDSPLISTKDRRPCRVMLTPTSEINRWQFTHFPIAFCTMILWVCSLLLSATPSLLTHSWVPYGWRTTQKGGKPEMSLNWKPNWLRRDGQRKRPEIKFFYSCLSTFIKCFPTATAECKFPISTKRSSKYDFLPPRGKHLLKKFVQWMTTCDLPPLQISWKGGERIWNVQIIDPHLFSFTIWSHM